MSSSNMSFLGITSTRFSGYVHNMGDTFTRRLYARTNDLSEIVITLFFDNLDTAVAFAPLTDWQEDYDPDQGSSAVCPRCNSENVTLEPDEGKTNGPKFGWCHRWECEDCGHEGEWQ